MKQAAALLQHSDLPIKKIAYMMGFEDLAYFSNVFRGEMGKSPRGYRTAGGSKELVQQPVETTEAASSL